MHLSRLVMEGKTVLYSLIQDGTGIIPSVQIATLSTGLALTSSNIFVEN
ncbi:hypothetical protein [Geminocystis sp. GBBB08]|nr:hypothetical protein [Geminocystis sp. GBBB08]